MPTSREFQAVLDRDFLEIRSKILEIAAGLDRLDRAPTHHAQAAPPDRRLAQIRQALEALLVPDAGRAETIQRIFSRDYSENWQAEFGLKD